MFRVHQFDKVEMYVYCVPEQSREIHDELLAHEEEIVQELGLPYRVQNIAVGDLGASAATSICTARPRPAPTWRSPCPSTTQAGPDCHPKPTTRRRRPTRCWPAACR